MRAAPSPSTRFDLGLLLMRLMLAVVFLFHGSMKLFGWFGGDGLTGMAEFNAQIGLPFPMAGAIVAGMAEFMGALALLAGLAVRWAVLPLIFMMLVASFTAHRGAFWVADNGMEFTLTLAVFLAALGIMGPGRFTVPWLMSRRQRSGDPAATAPNTQRPLE
jgi:putative oxidoreductase